MRTPPPLSLYVHLPWCVRKCPYCDFNSHALQEPLPQQAYVDALLLDLRWQLPALRTRHVDCIFIGGGTPSLFEPRAIAQLLKGVSQSLDLSPRAEITLEANPGTVDQARFRGFREAGVNRLSLGVQSFDDAKLTALGRIHSAGQATEAVRAAQAAGFERLNIDLMFGLPGQTGAQAMVDLEQAFALAPEHISWYQLTLEPNTAFAAHPPTLPDPDAIAQWWQTGRRRLAAAGYEQYEVSAYARPGGRCGHNLNYWHYGDYLGIGAGAHSKLSDADTGAIRRLRRWRHPRRYLEHAGSAAVLSGADTVAPSERVLEFMMNALRLTHGFALPLFEARTGLPSSVLQPMLNRARELGLIEIAQGRMSPTRLGQAHLNSVLEIFSDPPHLQGEGGTSTSPPASRSASTHSA